MMHFDLCINGEQITKFSVVNKGAEPGIDHGKAHVYEWTSWRPDKDYPQSLPELTISKVLHHQNDPIEELAFAVLSDWRTLRVRSEQ